MKLSRAQQKIVDRMKSGESLSLDAHTGRYILKKNGIVADIDQRPVLVLIRDGAIHQELSGSCHLGV